MSIEERAKEFREEYFQTHTIDEIIALFATQEVEKANDEYKGQQIDDAWDEAKYQVEIKSLKEKLKASDAENEQLKNTIFGEDRVTYKELLRQSEQQLKD